MNQQADEGTEWARRQRELAASLARLADGEQRIARDLRACDDHVTRAIAAEAGVPMFEEIAAMGENGAYRLRTLQRLIAEQARSYDAFIAAGGMDNPEALASWRESCERASGLMPTDYGGDLGT